MCNGTIAAKLASIKQSIRDTAQEFGREAADIRLVAVSKTMPADCIDEAFCAGHRVFGENRVQEAHAKKPGVRPVRWHLIGPLQSNKVKLALTLFDVIETVDRMKLARRLANLMDETGFRAI